MLSEKFKIDSSEHFFEFRPLTQVRAPNFDEFFAIFQNLARDISLNYEAYELKLGSLLEPTSG